jgi:heme/copper-type cytochrome/quinol oxidase subunit 3
MTGLHGLHVVIGMIIMGFMLYFMARKYSVPVQIKSEILESLKGKQLRISDNKGNKLWESEKISEEVREIELVVKGTVSEEDTNSQIVKLENTGLYWHLVDIIWIFLFPLFYLIAM